MDKKMKKSCNMIDLISPLIDGELSPKDNASVLQHIESCAICRAEFNSLKSIDNMLRNIKPIEPSFDFARGFWKKIDALDALKTKKSRWSISNLLSWRWRWGWRPSLVSAAAAAVLLIVAGTVSYKQSAPSAVDAMGMLISEDVALYSDYEIINNLELFENWEEIIIVEEI